MLEGNRSFVLNNILNVTWHTLRSLVTRAFSWKEVLIQLFEFGNKCLGVIVLCVTFVGIIIVLEYSYHISMIIGSDSLVPSFATIMLTRELAPAVAGMLLASKMGASIAAELGSMKTSEQLDAYRMLGLNPVDLFVAPRVIASALASLALAIVSLFIAILGGWLAAVAVLGFTTGMYFQNLFVFIHGSDFLLCGVKALLFGASVPIISTTYGFRCSFGAEGVGMATTNSVVTNGIWIIILDFLVTYTFSVFQ